MLCLRRVKYGAFYEYLDRQHRHQFDRVASGHYARIVREFRPEKELSTSGTAGGGTIVTRLAMTADAVKDQTYFLAQLTQVREGSKSFCAITIVPVATICIHCNPHAAVVLRMMAMALPMSPRHVACHRYCSGMSAPGPAGARHVPTGAADEGGGAPASGSRGAGNAGPEGQSGHLLPWQGERASICPQCEHLCRTPSRRCNKVNTPAQP